MKTVRTYDCRKCKDKGYRGVWDDDTGRYVTEACDCQEGS